MSANFSNLKLINIIVHDVYKPNDGNARGSAHTTDYLIQLDDAAKEELSKRIVNVLGKESKSREMDIIETNNASCSYFSEQIIQINSEASFIKYSQEIAEKHAHIHTSRNWPSGILVIIQATISSANIPCLIIIKAEEQSGFLRNKTVQKKEAFRFLTSLFLTPQSKLYKIGVFIPGQSENKAILFDDTQSNTKEPAKYFYWSFLGLSIPQTGKQYTKEFFEHTSKFIEELQDATDEEKISYQQALYTELKTNKETSFRTKDFAEKYFTEEQQDNYLDYLEALNFPSTSIEKDTSLIKNWLKTRKLQFSNDIRITAPSTSFDDTIKIIKQTEDETIIKIIGKLKSQR